MLDEWNGCPEFFSLSRALEIFRQHLLLQKVIIFLKRKSLGAPELLNWVNLRLHVALSLSSWLLKLPILAVLAMILGSKTSEMDFLPKQRSLVPKSSQLPSLFVAIALCYRRHFPDIASYFQIQSTLAGYEELAVRFKPIRKGEIFFINNKSRYATHRCICIVDYE